MDDGQFTYMTADWLLGHEKFIEKFLDGGNPLPEKGGYSDPAGRAGGSFVPGAEAVSYTHLDVYKRQN